MEIFGVRVDAVSLEEAVRRVRQAVGGPKGPFLVVTPNPEQIVEAQEDEGFRKALNAADLAIADGVGLVVASRLITARSNLAVNQGSTLRRKGLAERVSGVELMERLMTLAAEKGWKIMLVGGSGETAARAARKLTIENGRLKIIGIEGIGNIKNPSREEEAKLIKEINNYDPDLLFVGFGAPWQEKWVVKHKKQLKAKVIMVVGGAFDQIVDPTLRPPKVVEKIGLGWLYRLLRQPWRIGRQIRLLEFGWMVVRKWFKD